MSSIEVMSLMSWRKFAKKKKNSILVHSFRLIGKAKTFSDIKAWNCLNVKRTKLTIIEFPTKLKKMIPIGDN